MSKVTVTALLLGEQGTACPFPVGFLGRVVPFTEERRRYYCEDPPWHASPVYDPDRAVGIFKVLPIFWGGLR